MVKYDQIKKGEYYMNFDNIKLQRAITYVDRLANGYNPRTNEHLNNILMNDPSFIRCMFFIKDVLDEVYNNGCTVGKKGKIIKPSFPMELLQNFQYKTDLSITNLFRQINELGYNNYEPLKHTKVLQWLKDNNYLTNFYYERLNKNCTLVTDEGKKLGLYNELRTKDNREYLGVFYNKNAQEFIVNNLEMMLKD